MSKTASVVIGLLNILCGVATFSVGEKVTAGLFLGIGIVFLVDPWIKAN